MKNDLWDHVPKVYEMVVRVEVAKEISDPSLAVSRAFRAMWNDVREHPDVIIEGVYPTGGQAIRLDQKCSHHCEISSQMIETYEHPTVAREMAA